MKKPIAMLKDDPENPREISAAALEGLAVSMEEFGDLSGIVWNRKTGELVCGHQRVKDLRAAGATEFVIEGDEAYVVHPKTEERFRVRIVEWDRDKQRLANIVANNPEIAGDFTAEALEQLRELENEARFADLRLEGLRDDLEKELAREERRLEREAAGGGADQSGELQATFDIIITCRDEEHQRQLLDRFETEGLKCRALI